MIQLTALSEVERFINDHQLSFIYISRKNCGVCEALLPRLKQMLTQFPRIQFSYVDADEVVEIAGRFLIFAVPTLLLFVDGKELVRESRFVRMQVLQEKVSKIDRMVK